ncbi:MAG: transcriptional regulator NrdR [Nitrospinota bacterium]|nr:transcriptional regulator NrdR [Nitrospinota bacterium]
MKCPACQHPDTKVVDSRLSKEGDTIRRRRECIQCEERFTTHERIEEILPAVIKKDGRREEFNRDKIRRGIDKAFQKLAVSVAEKEALLDRLEKFARECGDKEISSSVVGEKIMEELKSMDQVAYVRFASVYRSFRDVNEFMDELKNLLKDK